MAESAYRHSPEEYSAEMCAINQRLSQLSTFENIFDEDIQKEIRSLKRERKTIKKENNRNKRIKEARNNPLINIFFSAKSTTACQNRIFHILGN